MAWRSYSGSNVRKRVCRACDRCRLKKTKCDGSRPCSRCHADNATCIFGERKKPHDKVYPKGYCEMLEQQQKWMVHGLQELYRRNTEGKGWPGKHLKLEPNGHPLTHDLLMRLGALGGTKGEHLEEGLEALQQDLWRTNAGMQRQQSLEDGSDSPQSPVTPSRFLSDAFFEHTMPPAPPTYRPSARAPIKNEPQTQFAEPRAMQTMANPLALQGAQHWPSNEFNLPGEMNSTSTANYPNISFEDQQIFSYVLNGQVPTNCVSQGSYLYYKGDYGDLTQFLNPSPTEIVSISACTFDYCQW